MREGEIGRTCSENIQLENRSKSQTKHVAETSKNEDTHRRITHQLAFGNVWSVFVLLNLNAPRFFNIGTGVSLLSRERFLYI